MRFWLPALLAMAVLPASAHHPFTPYYDASKPGSITGQIVELRSINPHVVLIIEGTAPDGRTGRWAFEGLPPTVLRRRQQDYKERLQVGTRITISGWPAKDPQARAFSGTLLRSRTGRRWSSDRPRRGHSTAGAARIPAHTGTLTHDHSERRS
jgi:hypothetical protein